MSEENKNQTETNKHILEPGLSAILKVVTPDTNDEKDNKETNNK